MDEVVTIIMKDIGIDEKFIKNPATYRIIKKYIRIKLKDLYSYIIFSEQKDPIECTQEEICQGLKTENQDVDLDEAVDKFEVRMLKYYKMEMNEPQRWETIISKIKHNIKIMERLVKIVSDENKLYISYNSPWEIENIGFFLNKYNGNIDVKKTIESLINDKNPKTLFCAIEEKFDPEGELIETSEKDFYDDKDKEQIKKQVEKIKRRYYDNTFEKLETLKNESGLKFKNALQIIMARLKKEQQQEIKFNNEREK